MVFKGARCKGHNPAGNTSARKRQSGVDVWSSFWVKNRVVWLQHFFGRNNLIAVKQVSARNV
jgi:hypothetical protein